MRLSRWALFTGVAAFAAYLTAVAGVLAVVYPERAPPGLASFRAALPVTGLGSLVLGFVAIGLSVVALRRLRGDKSMRVPRREAIAGLLLGLAHLVFDGLFFLVSTLSG